MNLSLNRSFAGNKQTSELSISVRSGVGFTGRWLKNRLTASMLVSVMPGMLISQILGWVGAGVELNLVARIKKALAIHTHLHASRIFSYQYLPQNAVVAKLDAIWSISSNFQLGMGLNQCRSGLRMGLKVKYFW